MVENTPREFSTTYRIAIAMIQMKNSTIDRTSEILNADQMSMCRSCSRARRGPRPAALPLPPRAFAAPPAGRAVGAAVRAGPPGGGADGGAGRAAAGAAAGAADWARIAPLAGIDWVADTGGGPSGRDRKSTRLNSS